MDDNYKEVLFDLYCQKCKYVKLDESEDPCHECLHNTVNLYSHVPVKFEEAPVKKGKRNG